MYETFKDRPKYTSDSSAGYCYQYYRPASWLGRYCHCGPHGGRAGIDEYGLKLFGNKIEWIGYDADWESGMKYNYVDSSYLQIALEYGIIVLAVILLLYALLIFTSIKNKKYYLCWLALIILVFCVTEPRLVKLAYNPFLLLAVTESSKYFLNRFGQKNRGTDNEETEIVNS